MSIYCFSMEELALLSVQVWVANPDLGLGLKLVSSWKTTKINYVGRVDI